MALLNDKGRLLARVSAGMAVCLAFTGLLSCTDEELEGEGYVSEKASDEAAEYWHTGLRSARQESMMLKSHGVGFSYDAIYGKKCDVGSVRCQVLDLDGLEADDLYEVNMLVSTKTETSVAHSVAQYFQNTNVDISASIDAYVFSGDIKKVAAIFEKGDVQTMLITNSRVVQIARKIVDMVSYQEVVSDLPEKEKGKYLSESFKYGIERVKDAVDKGNEVTITAVLDSFINVFGTHVVVDGTIGGRLDMEITTSTKQVKTYSLESQVTNMALDVYFYEMEKHTTEEERKAIASILRSADLTIKARGGNMQALSEVIASPYTFDEGKNSKMMAEWMEGFRYDMGEPWNSKCELAEMKIEPIWDFIPDERVRLYVKDRIVATVPTKQELYGNRNYIDITFPKTVTSVTSRIGNKSKTIDNPWVVDITAAGRRVATICREWVPEIDKDGTVTVAYPIYENKLDDKAGVCMHDGVLYGVSWLYGQFVVDTIRMLKGDEDRYYLSAGCIDVVKEEGVKYQEGLPIIGYEWPGSIGTDGSLTGTEYYETRKFLDGFYLTTDKKFENLPNWTYVTTAATNNKYDEMLKGSNKPYELSGIAIGGRSGKANMENRMVRDADYRYVWQTSEIGYVSHK